MVRKSLVKAPSQIRDNDPDTFATGPDSITANAMEAWDPRTNWSYPSLAQDLFVRASV